MAEMLTLAVGVALADPETVLVTVWDADAVDVAEEETVNVALPEVEPEVDADTVGEPERDAVMVLDSLGEVDWLVLPVPDAVAVIETLYVGVKVDD